MKLTSQLYLFRTKNLSHKKLPKKLSQYVQTRPWIISRVCIILKQFIGIAFIGLVGNFRLKALKYWIELANTQLYSAFIYDRFWKKIYKKTQSYNFNRGPMVYWLAPGILSPKIRVQVSVGPKVSLFYTEVQATDWKGRRKSRNRKKFRITVRNQRLPN